METILSSYRFLLISLLAGITFSTSYAQVTTLSLDPGSGGGSCSIPLPDGDFCLGDVAVFRPNCTEGSTYDTFSWSVDNGAATTTYAFNYTCTTAGSHTVYLTSSCASCSGVSTHISISVQDKVTPVISATPAAVCESGAVTLRINNPASGTYRWYIGTAYQGTGTTFTTGTLSTGTTYSASYSNGTCSSSSSYTVPVDKTVIIPQVDPTVYYHKKGLTGSVYSSNHFWQENPAGTGTTHPYTANPYVVTTPGTYYLRKYNATTSCWTTASAPVAVTLNYAPPLAAVVQVKKPGYTEIVFTDPDKEHILRYANYYWVKDTRSDPEIINAYNTEAGISGNRITGTGTYYLKGRDRETTTWGPTLTLTAELQGDDVLNWVQTTTYDGNDHVVAAAKAYFDEAGKPLQSQVKSLEKNTVFASQSLRDRYDRVVGSTLSAPIKGSAFAYNGAFLNNTSNQVYSSNDFDTPATLNNPAPVDDNMPFTIGWYYSNHNTVEDHVPVTKFPYSRNDFYDDGTGEARKGAGPGDQHYLGSGHEVLSGTFPVYNELDDYLAMRRNTGMVNLRDNVMVVSLMKNGVQNVARDQNGKYGISITDKSGKVLLSARHSSVLAENVLTLSSTINATNDPSADTYRQMTYFYILEDQAVTLTGSNYVVENFVTNEKKEIGQTFADPNNGNKWPAGFYRILLPALTNGTNSPYSYCTLTYSNSFADVSYQFYDDAGRLKTSVSPNGFKQLKSNVAYTAIDKTTYTYNHQGWLLSMTEPDAGTTQYKYRKDGTIRFSQNARQADHETNQRTGKGKFSYTNYDYLGRPTESGEYTGTATFASMSSAVEFNAQLTYTEAEKKDWVRTYYDDADVATGLPADYTQNYVRNTVSHSQNAHAHTWYSYDEVGRVTWMAQKPAQLARFFVVRYTYDFTGNVLTVANLAYDLQGALKDQFYHDYEYDKDQRLTNAYTRATGDGDQKIRAHYDYYLHGPLKRIVLGDHLQGLDFVYNINGWLTQINHPDPAQDPGQDGTNGVKADVFGLVLEYYESDLSNLYVSSIDADASRDVKRRHHLPVENESALTATQPLIRFALPGFMNETIRPGQPYGAQNPVYKKMLQQRTEN